MTVYLLCITHWIFLLSLLLLLISVLCSIHSILIGYYKRFSLNHLRNYLMGKFVIENENCSKRNLRQPGRLINFICESISFQNSCRLQIRLICWFGWDHLGGRSSNLYFSMEEPYSNGPK